MRKWGFSPQKPKKRAYEQSPKAVKQWLETKYPAIKSRAKDEGAEIHWGDETGIKNNCNHGRSYSPKGRMPVKKSMSKRFSINMISALSNQGLLRFMMYDETMTARVLLRFLKRLIEDAGRKVFLVLDNLRVHHAKLVKAWLEKHIYEIEIFYLPAYSPGLNPDEYLNADLKAGIRSAAPARSKSDLKGKVCCHMRMLQRRSERI